MEKIAERICSWREGEREREGGNKINEQTSDKIVLYGNNSVTVFVTRRARPNNSVSNFLILFPLSRTNEVRIGEKKAKKKVSVRREGLLGETFVDDCVQWEKKWKWEREGEREGKSYKITSLVLFIYQIRFAREDNQLFKKLLLSLLSPFLSLPGQGKQIHCSFWERKKERKKRILVDSWLTKPDRWQCSNMKVIHSFIHKYETRRR